MKTREEWIKSPLVVSSTVRPSHIIPNALTGTCIPKKTRATFIASPNEDGWEHVSISFISSTRLPTWDEMCSVKDIFWRDEEEVLQVHPPKSCYLHGVGDCKIKIENVMHLWRRVGRNYLNGDGAE
jgi:hypothetical protein